MSDIPPRSAESDPSSVFQELINHLGPQATKVSLDTSIASGGTFIIGGDEEWPSFSLIATSERVTFRFAQRGPFEIATDLASLMVNGALDEAAS
ncbi:MAG: hypothetical protein V4702_05475 [Patescibacteria group bacterium]